MIIPIAVGSEQDIQSTPSRRIAVQFHLYSCVNDNTTYCSPLLSVIINCINTQNFQWSIRFCKVRHINVNHRMYAYHR